MTDVVELAGWRLRVDAEATRGLYGALPTLTCKCGYCKNFVAAFPALPEVDRALFAQLGIDPTREGGEVYVYEADRESGVHCAGVMLAVGEIIESPSLAPEHIKGGAASTPEYPVTDRLSGYFTSKDSLVSLYLPEPPNPHFVFNFTFNRLPWVIDDDPDGPVPQD